MGQKYGSVWVVRLPLELKQKIVLLAEAEQRTIMAQMTVMLEQVLSQYQPKSVIPPSNGKKK